MSLTARFFMSPCPPSTYELTVEARAFVFVFAYNSPSVAALRDHVVQRRREARSVGQAWAMGQLFAFLIDTAIVANSILYFISDQGRPQRWAVGRGGSSHLTHNTRF